MPKHTDLDYRAINRNFDPAPMPGETFLPVPGYEGLYEVSDYGRVISHKGKRPRVLNGSRNAKGYIQVSMSRGGKVNRPLVHRLVALAHIGQAPSDKQSVLHANDISRDNRLSNLRYGTSAENSRDMVLNGGSPKANKSHCPRGHAYVAANTHVWNGGRYCISCSRARSAAQYAAKIGRSFDFNEIADQKYIELTAAPDADLTPVLSASLDA